jgi:hypothetical protein
MPHLNVVFSSPLIAIPYFLASLLIGILGRNRVMGFWGYFFGSILLTPLMGLLLFLVSAKSGSNNV